MAAVAEDVAGLIGGTPMVRINNMVRKRGVQLFAKLERANPGGSVKDRICKYMVEQAEREGVLTKNKTIIEPTSGNTGIGLSMIAAAKGYRIKLVMPESMSIERRKILQLFGAELVLTPKERGMDGAIDIASEMAKDTERYWMPDQFSNPINVLAHYETTGREIWEQTGGKVTHFVAGMGTGGTLMGVGKRLREHNPRIRITGIEPHKETPIQGLKNMETSYVPKILDMSRLDEKIIVNLQDAIGMARRLAREEGLFVGLSSGAAMFGALKVIEGLDEGVVVVFFPDDGMKYLSTGLVE
ncbi:cysteine synthase B [Candidatus Micrarchaeota archaeon RBG_16_49_10]|nr:MAG: cysteine synthase B [Candidatus Micrarchaeota archaeon RBG_16_49_10]